MERTILHCDLNGFYASVECLLRPELREVPMAVCGNPELRHGIILAKNEAAKAFGVVTAETIWQAQRKCPGLVLVAPHREEYEKYSKLANQVYCRYTDLVEPFGIDESWLDITGTVHLFGDGQTVADTIRGVMQAELGLTVSVGVSFNKVFAKLGSDYRKPNATTLISRENFHRIVDPLPVSALLYVGGSVQKTLMSLGIETIGELAKCPRQVIVSRLGKAGESIHDYANGLDSSPVASADQEREIKSVGNGMTFSRNLCGMGDIKTGVTALADEVAARLRKHGLDGQTVQVQIRDPSFKTISRQKALAQPTHLAHEIGAEALELIKASWKIGNPIRMITITVSSLGEMGTRQQISLFAPAEDPRRKKLDQLERAVDGIRGRYGKNAIAMGSAVKNDIGLTHPGKDETE